LRHRMKGNKEQCRESFKVANKAETIGNLQLVRSFPSTRVNGRT
jgi:hypothetical protein